MITGQGSEAPDTLSRGRAKAGAGAGQTALHATGPRGPLLGKRGEQRQEAAPQEGSDMPERESDKGNRVCDPTACSVTETRAYGQ